MKKHRLLVAVLITAMPMALAHAATPSTSVNSTNKTTNPFTAHKHHKGKVHVTHGKNGLPDVAT